MTANTIGPVVGTGRTATVHEFGEGRVIKVLRDGFPHEALAGEAASASIVAAAGAPIPSVYGIVEVDGRRGLVFERADGELLLDELALDPMRYRQWARTLAKTHVDILTSTSTDLPARTDVMAERIEQADLAPGQRAAALDVLAKAPDGDAVLHGDFHPGNVILTKEGPLVIDWIDVARGHPSADIARSLWLLTAGDVPGEGINRRVVNHFRKGFVKRYLGLVSRATSVNRRVIDAWRLPTIAARLWEEVEEEEPAIRAELDRLVG